MADFNSTQYAKKGSLVRAPDFLVPSELSGELRVAYADYTTDQVLSQNDRIILFDLPRGARPLFYAVWHGAFGASVTLDIGYGALDAATENAFASALDVSAAGVKFAPVPTGGQVPLTADVTVAIQFEGGNPSDTADISVAIYYVFD
jgi:hypothetical protein